MPLAEEISRINIWQQMFRNRSVYSTEGCVNIRSNFPWQNIHHVCELFMEDSNTSQQ